MIIKTDYIFEDITNKAALWVPGGAVDNDVLIRSVVVAVENNVNKISVPFGVVERVWPWVEQRDIKLFTRLNFSDFYTDDMDSCISKVASQISSEFRRGAGGAQVFLSKSNLDAFVQGVISIRQDLFFNKDLSVCLKIDDFGIDDWKNVFEKLNKIKADSLLLWSKGEQFDAKSDFVGRAFSVVESWGTYADLHLMFGKNMLRVGQMIRLVQKMRPELEDKITVFVEN